jgi:RNA polymerase sigma factor (sigma-70 family)
VIERVWGSFDTSERVALRLRHVEGLTYREIADRLAVSTSQVVRIVERSSKRLRIIIHASDGTGETQRPPGRSGSHSL